MANEITKITFHGAELVVQKGEAPETTLVAMRPLVEGMKLDWATQFTKIKNHPVLGASVGEIATVAEDGRTRKMTALPLNRLHFWMATLHPNKIPDPQIRERVIIFQNEAADTLFDKFFGRALAKGDVSNHSVGGVVKGVLTKHDREVLIPELEAMMAKAMSSLLPAMIDHELATNPRVAALDYISVRELLTEAKAMAKGRDRLNRKVGWELRSRALLTKPPVQLRRCPHSGVWLFPREFALAYMGEFGLALVRAHNAKVLGQGVLQFHLRKKPPVPAPEDEGQPN